ncbi:MAG: mitochondrial fission ELM1 family protein [Methyloligellaceae bacterium]
MQSNNNKQQQDEDLDMSPEDTENGNRRTAWIITGGKAGMNAQCIGVAEALNTKYEFIKAAPTGPWKWFAPWVPVVPWHTANYPDSPLNPPWPDIAIACGRISQAYLKEIKRAVGSKTFTVYLQDPRHSCEYADLIWASEHDKMRGPKVITTITSPHAHSFEKLQKLRGAAHELLDSMPYPRVMITLGGPNKVYRYKSASINRLIRAIKDLCELGASFLITPSRRTPKELSEAVEIVTRDRPRVLWDGEGENPYAHFLAKADYFLVTGDSVNMTGEACSTGRPVYTFMPDGGSAKFDRFHTSLQNYGATRLLPDRITTLDDWQYEPLDSASVIADEIRKRW